MNSNLWKGNFSLIENGISSLGLITLVFVVVTIKLHPSLTSLGAGLLPRQIGLTILKKLGARKIYSGYSVSWYQLDLTDIEKPCLLCHLEELKNSG
jgi:hypothetical protein